MHPMSMSDVVLQTVPLGAPPWPTLDPFLFCVHHFDAYPAGEEHMGPPAKTLAGRAIGSDFSGKDGWSMYHGERVPGFPAHPHRGFETVTVVRQGHIDHSDSLGATARFGPGDVQWMTAGRGIVHCEMFPLRERDKGNTGELFQIWMNLPAKDKLVEPHFKMLWDGTIPEVRSEDAEGRETRVRVVAGSFGDARAPSPPPHSWASRPEAGVAIWTIKMAAGSKLTLPASTTPDVARVAYFFEGGTLAVEGTDKTFTPKTALVLDADQPATLEARGAPADILVLQGRPIGEPVAQHGPFVMNTKEEIMKAFEDYRATRFGEWPWESEAPVHPRERGRFAKHADGTVEEGR